MLRCKSLRMWNFPPDFPCVVKVLIVLVLTFSSSAFLVVSGQDCVDDDDCFPKCCDFDSGKCVDGPCLSSHEFEGFGKTCECHHGEKEMCEKLNKGMCIQGRIRPFCCEGQTRGQFPPTSAPEPGPEPGPGPDPGQGSRRILARGRSSQTQSRSKSNLGRGMSGPSRASIFGKTPEADYCDCSKGTYWRRECMRETNGCCDPNKRMLEGCCYVKQAHEKCSHTEFDIKQYLYDT